MFKILFALHLLTAIFAIGPLVHAATTASRGLRHADASATASSARTVSLYANVSVLVVIFGFGVMSMDDPDGPGKIASFSETWIWLSTLLWLAACGVATAVISPTLKVATTRIGAGQAVENLTAKVAASGGIVGLIFAAIVFLMVYKPGN